MDDDADRLTCRRATARIGGAILLVCSVSAARPALAPLESRFVLARVVDQAGQPIAGLRLDDIMVENGGVSCQVVAVRPASYPLAIILDTSSYARSDFRMLQAAVERFVSGLSPREIAIYTSGEPASRVLDFTADRSRIARAVKSTVAAPNGAAHTLEAILRASRDLTRLDRPVTGILAVSAGGTEMSPPSSQQVFQALQASGSILNIIDERTFRIGRGVPQADEGALLDALATRSHGKYFLGAGPAVFASGAEAVLHQLGAESIVEYVVPFGAARSVSLRVKAPAIVVMAVGLDR